MSDNAMKGYKIRGFDITGEFEDIVREYNGKQIALDGSQGQINPLQVYKTAKTEEGSFTQHLSKLSIFYRFIAPEAKDDEIKEYENLLRKLYVQKSYGMMKRMLSIILQVYQLRRIQFFLITLTLCRKNYMKM